MSRKYLVILILLCSFLAASVGLLPQVCQAAAAAEVDDSCGDEFSEYDEVESFSDPLEGMNRVFFTFNDTLRRWFLEPTARGYRKVTPNMFRTGLLNFFNNLLEPTRVINCLLQGRFTAAGETFLRFALNSTAGVGGLMDPATFDGMKSHEYQFTSTLAHYGAGSGSYLILPLFGPSDIRGTFGLAGDTLASPLFYVTRGDLLAALAVKGSNAINRTSFKLGEYEKLISGSLDPYIAVRDAYVQHQRKLWGVDSDMIRGLNPCVLE
ncbi:MAG: VacJ family lipoprotein [Pseudomonadota bacterium]|nr:VacJ family lipoprotein [Pseudomonadota bacterium]